MGPAIEFDGVTLGPDGAQFHTLGDQNWVVPPGQFIALMGGSGCGKTTFLRALAGLVLPQSGKIAFLSNGEVLTDLCGRLGFMYQDPIRGLFPWRTLRGNLEMPTKLRRNGNSASSIADDWINRLQLQALRTRYPHELSGGERKRLLFGMVLSCNPELILLDEPFTGLDYDLAVKLWQELSDCQRKSNATVVMVTHSVREAAVLAQQVLILCDKKIHQVTDGAYSSRYASGNIPPKVAERLENPPTLAFQSHIQHTLTKLLISQQR